MARYFKVPDRDSFQVDHVALQLFSSGDGAWQRKLSWPLERRNTNNFEPDLPAPEAAQGRRTTPTGYRLMWRYSIRTIFGKANGGNWSSRARS
jgi:hypothetical protein